MPEPFKARGTRRNGPESQIQKAWISFLTIRGWHVMVTHGNMYQSGFPDLYITHYTYRHRWVEIKNPGQYVFTPAQLKNFPLMSANGSPIWILGEVSDFEYKKLWRPENWHTYLPGHYNVGRQA